jgi:DNA-binding MarR family transcriptional regulator
MANGSNGKPDDMPDSITLGVLSVIEEDNRATQRSISQELGIALGLTNAYLKKCVRKGFVKVRQIPANRYAYYLTPQGFAEKSRLTAEYLSISFKFFRSSREQCTEILDDCARRRWSRIALAGCGDLAEIATLCVRDLADVEIVGIIDTEKNQKKPAPAPSVARHFAGLPVVQRLTDLAKVHAIVVTDIQDAQRVFEELSREIPPERVLTVPLLKVSRVQPRLADD